MMKKWFVVLACIVCTLTACKKSGGILTVKEDNASVGKASEVLLVMDKTAWDTIFQDTVRVILNQPQPFVNQDIAMFDVFQLDPDLFNGNMLHHFNIVHFELNENISEPTISIENNVWVKPQIYVHIKSADQATGVKMFLENQDAIIAALYENDLAKIQNANVGKQNADIQEKIRKKFGISLIVPQEYQLARETEDFIWLRYPTIKNDRFIMIYTSPTTALTKENMIENRNRISAKYIESKDEPDARPVVVTQFGLPFVCPLKIGLHEGMEMRGLWETDKDWMGGSFYHYSFVKDGKHTVSVDGFVYAPRDWTEKRDYLRQVEAIVKSVQ